MFVFIFNTTILFDPIEHIIEKRPKKTNTMNILSVEVKFYTLQDKGNYFRVCNSNPLKLLSGTSNHVSALAFNIYIQFLAPTIPR